MDEAVKQLEECATPLTSLKGAEIEEFPTPVSTLEAAEKLLATATEKVAEAKACAKEQQAKMPKAAKGPLFEAKKELTKLVIKAEAAGKTCTKSLQSVKAATEKIVEAKSGQASSAL